MAVVHADPADGEHVEHAAPFVPAGVGVPTGSILSLIGNSAW
ncbi:hypothetical protein [Micromonospora peucetia]|uniref:Uncharacterized protein n=1 Tax=Micromonospora peucetia TaxID=47871 RepID=A0ABZ1EDJ2_9ACTN|nr:hypothetical protein [Micromonospora peucetia]WSA31828.1 hypothetical protein OIE14_27505 [Micromonospora peucetia]